jgi:outer membrane lipoprotein SlyB
MKMFTIVLFAATALVSVATSAGAADGGRTVSGAAIGAGTGAVIAGPPGAIVGGVAGAVIGGPKLTHRRTYTRHRRHRVCHTRNHRRVCNYR